MAAHSSAVLVLLALCSAAVAIRWCTVDADCCPCDPNTDYYCDCTGPKYTCNQYGVCDAPCLDALLQLNPNQWCNIGLCCAANAICIDRLTANARCSVVAPAPSPVPRTGSITFLTRDKLGTLFRGLPVNVTFTAVVKAGIARVDFALIDELGVTIASNPPQQQLGGANIATFSVSSAEFSSSAFEFEPPGKPIMSQFTLRASAYRAGSFTADDTLELTIPVLHIAWARTLIDLASGVEFNALNQALALVGSGAQTPVITLLQPGESASYWQVQQDFKFPNSSDGVARLIGNVGSSLIPSSFKSGISVLAYWRYDSTNPSLYLGGYARAEIMIPVQGTWLLAGGGVEASIVTRFGDGGALAWQYTNASIGVYGAVAVVVNVGFSIAGFNIGVNVNARYTAAAVFETSLVPGTDNDGITATPTPSLPSQSTSSSAYPSPSPGSSVPPSPSATPMPSCFCPPAGRRRSNANADADADADAGLGMEYRSRFTGGSSDAADVDYSGGGEYSFDKGYASVVDDPAHAQYWMPVRRGADGALEAMTPATQPPPAAHHYGHYQARQAPPPPADDGGAPLDTMAIFPKTKVRFANSALRPYQKLTVSVGISAGKIVGIEGTAGGGMQADLVIRKGCKFISGFHAAAAFRIKAWFTIFKFQKTWGPYTKDTYDEGCGYPQASFTLQLRKRGGGAAARSMLLAEPGVVSRTTVSHADPSAYPQTIVHGSRRRNAGLREHDAVLHRRQAADAGTGAPVTGGYGGAPLVEGIFPFAEPTMKVHERSGQVLSTWAFWDNSSAVPKSVVFASVFANSEWSDFAQISTADDSVHGDFRARVAPIGTDDFLATFTRVYYTGSPPDYVDLDADSNPDSPVFSPAYLSTFEIMWSRFDTATKTWSAAAKVTDNGFFDYTSSLASWGTQAMAVWVADIFSDWFSVGSHRQLRFALYDDVAQRWTAPAVAATSLNFEEPPVCDMGPRGHVVCMFVIVAQGPQLADGTYEATSTMYYLVYNAIAQQWSVPARIGSARVAGQAQVHARPDGSFVVAWVHDNVLATSVIRLSAQSAPQVVLQDWIKDPTSVALGGDSITTVVLVANGTAMLRSSVANFSDTLSEPVLLQSFDNLESTRSALVVTSQREWNADGSPTGNHTETYMYINQPVLEDSAVEERQLGTASCDFFSVKFRDDVPRAQAAQSGGGGGGGNTNQATTVVINGTGGGGGGDESAKTALIASLSVVLSLLALCLLAAVVVIVVLFIHQRRTIAAFTAAHLPGGGERRFGVYTSGQPSMSLALGTLGSSSNNDDDLSSNPPSSPRPLISGHDRFDVL